MGKIQSRTLASYMKAEKNIIISGVHGVGKTAKLREAAGQLGFKMKYYSASTLDSFTDITGIPVPNIEKKTVEYYRPTDIEDAEVIFFDEVNRADKRTMNSIFEITQFGTVNGIPLPNLKSVVAAMNPVDDRYDTEELDQAFLDRFDIFLQADPECDLPYFVNKFGDQLGTAIVESWNEYHASHTKSLTRSRENEIPYLSPRRFDKIAEMFQIIPTLQTIKDSLPPEITDASVASNLHRSFTHALKPKPKASESQLAAQVEEITMKSILFQQSQEAGALSTEILRNESLKPADKDKLLSSLASALSTGISASDISERFALAVSSMSPTQFVTMTGSWSASKTKSLKNALGMDSDEG